MPVMTGEEKERLLALIKDPPRKSKIAAAKRAGVNLRLNVYLLSLTPTQRVERLEFVLSLEEQLAMACGSLTQSILSESA